jgi:uncharacterized membrane protein
MSDPDVQGTASKEEPHLEELWQFAGQGLRASDFNTAMVHFYRGEVSRSNTWRNRLDATTNWAVITTGAALTFTFGTTDNTHMVLVAVTMLVLFFLFIEARRYRYYELWTYRVRLMETQYYTGLLSPPFVPSSDWADRVVESLRNPTFPITLAEAFGRRYRRNYGPIFLILALGWVVKIAVHPAQVSGFADFVQRAQIGGVPGWAVILGGAVVHVGLMAIGLFTFTLQKSPGEVFDTSELTWRRRLGRLFRVAAWETLEVDLPHLPLRFRSRRHEQLVYVITDSDEAISAAVFEELGRGVTRLEGKGMFTGRPHQVLLCVYDSKQAAVFRRIIKRIDPEAFVIITDARDVRGAGFRPLEA